MKKIIALLLALSMLFALTACGGNDGSTPTGESTEETTSTTESTNNTTDGTEDSTQDTTEGTTGGDATDSTTPPTTTPPTTTPPTTTSPTTTPPTTTPPTTTPPATTPPTTETPNKTNDTTAPVITALSIAQQGQTLKAGDTLTLNLSINEESDISTCQIGFRNETTGATINAHGSFKHRADGKYSYTYRITDDMSSGKWVFSSTFIGDKYSMYGNDTISNKSNVFFYVENASSDTTAPVITALSITQQGQTLKAGDTLTLNLSITEESDISTCQIGFRNETTGATINAHGSFKHRADGKYSYTYRITDDMSSGKWVFSSTFIGDKYSMYGNDTISNKSNVFFYVENASSDTTAPVITALSIAQQGQTLKAGDTLTLNLSITEESDISTCQIVFRNETTGATINAHGSFKHRADGKYSYTYRITDDMSSGKWVFSSTFIGDKYSMYGNDTISNKSNVFFYVQ